MGEGARTARLTALLAGNGFAFIKILDYGEHYSGPPGKPFWGFLIGTVISFVGMGMAYKALGSPPSSRRAEYTSIGALLLLVCIWLLAMYSNHGG
jgi:hypothetical protein